VACALVLLPSVVLLSREGEVAADVPAAESTGDATFPFGAWALIFACSGLLALSLEIVWFRVLAISLGPSSYAFTLMLATVLAGIALGSAIITPVMRRRADWLQVLVVLQSGAALIALRSLHGLRRAPRAPDSLRRAVLPSPNARRASPVRRPRRGRPGRRPTETGRSSLRGWRHGTAGLRRRGSSECPRLLYFVGVHLRMASLQCEEAGVNPARSRHCERCPDPCRHPRVRPPLQPSFI